MRFARCLVFAAKTSAMNEGLECGDCETAKVDAARTRREHDRPLHRLITGEVTSTDDHEENVHCR